ncbi:MAG: hypothetical protein QG643_694 [Pseudomonadota bacterium]|nr:hypothetical protein [Pseudomonadota bacterium]
MTEPTPSLKATAAQVGDSALALLRARLDLASMELAEERERLAVRLGWLFAGILLLVFALLGVGVLAAALLWNTNRLLALLLPILGFALGGWWMLRRSQQLGRDAALPFAATIAEFDKDRALLGRQMTDAGTENSGAGP